MWENEVLKQVSSVSGYKDVSLKASFSCAFTFSILSGLWACQDKSRNPKLNCLSVARPSMKVEDSLILFTNSIGITSPVS